MNTLLIFFAFPIAVIIISIILENLLNNPVEVASLIFAIFIVVAFTAFDATFLIATLAYTVLAFITALLVHILKERKENNICKLLSNIIQNNNENSTNNDNETLCDAVENLMTTNNGNTSNNTNNCGCSRYKRRF